MKKPYNWSSALRHAFVPVAVILLLNLFFQYSFPKEKGVEIKAQNLSYEKEAGIVEAKGKAQALYKSTSVEADEIVFYSKQGRIVAVKNFSLDRNGLKITGRKLDYNIKNNTGSAEGVTIFSSKTWISGDHVNIGQDEIILSDASFSTCDLDNPHYKISASNMSFFQRSGWIMEYMGILWINGVPVFPVPTYVYDTGLVGGRYRKKNPLPLPEIGSNSVDGIYMIGRTVWRISGFSYGMLSLDYRTKKGLGGGFEGNYVMNDDNEGNVKLYMLGSEGWSWGASHTYYFGENIGGRSTRQKLYQVLEVPERRKYDVTADLSFRERINYERVTLMPMVTLRYIDIPFSFLDFRPKAEMSLASVSEESSGVSVFRGNINTSLDYFQDIAGVMNAQYGLDASYTVYDSSGKWLKVLGRIDLNKKLGDIAEAGAGYGHYFVNDGSSPFRYENYRYFPFDELRTHVRVRYGSSYFGIALSYNTPLFTVRDIDYNATVRMHCLNATATWRAARQEFTISLALDTE